MLIFKAQLVCMGAQAACLHERFGETRKLSLKIDRLTYHTLFSRLQRSCRQGCLRSQRKAFFLNFTSKVINLFVQHLKSNFEI